MAVEQHREERRQPARLGLREPELREQRRVRVLAHRDVRPSRPDAPEISAAASANVSSRGPVTSCTRPA
ncbi:hypothetical protein [Streptomyces sp. NPDC093600]|uniref:hypothetical protein n=1 Tax=Streptomyces sp. NPDC093600 TaxID=3366047 RepID=UPI003801C633